ncbi:hypothetical protein [Enterobacter hormaechei]|uniref:hypothetical protein n=1 Tax=Enterobacter hormaechei TaxID=158836 RepID=UPI0031382134
MKLLDKFNITVSDTLSLLALVISGVAAYFTIQADFRSQNTDRQVSLVVMESIGDKLKRYAENANSSYRVLRAYREMVFEYPEKQVTSENLTLEYLEKQSTRDVSFSEDLLLLLAKSESETAQKIARCYSLYESTVNDAKQFSGTTPETLTIGVRLENGNYPTLRLYFVQQWRRMRDQQFINRDSFLLKRLNGSFYINRIPECYRRRM